MKKNLVIVESPTKAKTIKNFLPSGYRVVSSMGHIRDLPKKVIGVDVDNGFKQTYTAIPGKKKVISMLKKEYRDSENVYLATDGDREGEGIAWHIKELLKIPESKIRRTVFHEITKSAIKDAFDHPGSINNNMVGAYRARRALDRLVGYKISPILWRNIASGLSAGRVQSAALKMIVEREREIREFVPQVYWKVAAAFSRGAKKFTAALAEVGTEKLKDGKISDPKLIESVGALEGSEFTVLETSAGVKKINSPRPFTTSTLQQQANTVLGFSSKRTMSVAQRLYEGVETPGGRTGLITYMRTDSVAVAVSAKKRAREFVEKKLGKNYLPAKPPVYKAKSAHTQEAHEAIRPTDVFITPDEVRASLAPEQFALYELIWKKFLSSQMKPAVSDVITVRLEKNGFVFKATQSALKEAGFLTLYKNRMDEDLENRKKYKVLESLKKGVFAKLDKIEKSEHETQPPAHFNDASLVKTLEEKGIGRPSTYASIIETLIRRKYVERNRRQLLLREIGEVVIKVVDKNFPLVTDYNFTSELEDKLDDIAEARSDETKVLGEFYGKFSKLLEKAKTSITSFKKVTDRKCPWCGAPLIEKYSATGKFLYCSSGYKACVYRVYFVDGKELTPVKKQCPKCGMPMVLRISRRGPFYACSGYPKCKTIVPYEPQEESGGN